MITDNACQDNQFHLPKSKAQKISIPDQLPNTPHNKILSGEQKLYDIILSDEGIRDATIQICPWDQTGTCTSPINSVTVSDHETRSQSVFTHVLGDGSTDISTARKRLIVEYKDNIDDITSVDLRIILDDNDGGDQRTVTNGIRNPETVTDVPQNPHTVTNSSNNQHIVTDSSSNQHIVTDSSRNQHTITDSSSNQHSVTDSSSNQHIVTDSSSNQHIVTDSSRNQHTVTDSSSNQHSVTDGSSNQHIVTDSSRNQHIVTDSSSNQHIVTDEFQQSTYCD